jgi:tetratricopeptide (TPR) repeat protein
MRIIGAIAVVLFLAAATEAHAQGAEQVPDACKPGARGSVDFAACAGAAPAGSNIRVYALINLGTAAYIAGDYTKAARLYDEAVPPGKTVMSDVYFHAFRAGAYQHVGRKDEAYKDARFALDILSAKPGLPPEIARADGDREPIYVAILPILKESADPDYASALAAFLALPVNDWIGWSNRAAILSEIGELGAAAEASAAALKLNPTHPAVLNNHCYMLAMSGDPAGALPYCEKVVQAAPGHPAGRHSLATTLALLGRCADAEAALAEARRLDPGSENYRQPLTCKAK